MVIDSTESGATATDNCERAFGLIRASWATRNNHRHADDQASFLETFERSVSRFESEYTATVIYDDDGAVRYSFGEPQQPAAVEEIYDGAETISAYEGSVLPPKKLSDLTVIIAREEMQRDGVCVAITLEPTSVKKNFYFACGRKLTSASEGALCGRHKQFPYSCDGANVGKIYEWGDGQYAAVCPENGCAYMKIFSGKNGEENASQHAMRVGYISLAAAVSPCLNSELPKVTAEEMVTMEHQAGRIKGLEHHLVTTDGDAVSSVASTQIQTSRAEPKSVSMEAMHKAPMDFLSPPDRVPGAAAAYNNTPSSPVSPSPRWFAVSVGERTGVFESWAACSPLVTDYPGARHKSFWHREDAEAWYQEQMAGLAREEQDRREQAVAERERALARNAEQRRLTSAYIASKSATQYFYSHQTQVQRMAATAPFDPRVRGAVPASLLVAGNAGYFGGPASPITRDTGTGRGRQPCRSVA
jgi:hypothetical protein